ncbi:MAG TPA: hypothetical protein VFP22_05205 [Candidatus Limnocylindrales bacterium]|nr:hypothetical protein [Candidatus Limnocylindrales bacterium]
MSTLGSLLDAMRVTPDSDVGRWMAERGVALADQETMSQAIHDVYCGIAADHAEPNEKDHAQALAMIGALQKYAESRPPA